MEYFDKLAVKDIEGAYDRYLAGIKAVRERGANIEKPADEGGVKLHERYSYDSLTAKPDMNVTEVIEKDYKALGLTRADIVNSAIENAGAIGRLNEKNNAVVHVNDIDTDVIITPRNLKHGLDRRINVVGPVTERIGEILQNSIRINELVTRSEEVTDSYVLVGIAKNKQGVPFVVNMVVNRNTNELDSIDVLYSVNAKKESAVLNEPAVTAKPLRITDSTISISNLLDYVNRYFPDILPEDVIKL